MNFPFYIARRYLLSSRLPVALNLIASLSIIGVAFGTALLIIVLSVFNGFYYLIRDHYAPYDPDIRISPQKGKYLTLSRTTFEKLKNLPNIASATYSIEGRAIIKYNDKQRIIRLKGVTADYKKTTELASLVSIGQYGFLTTDRRSTVVMGSGVAYAINANIMDWREPMELFTVSEKTDLMTADPEKSLLTEYVYPAGIFSKQAEYDNVLVVSEFDMAQRLFEAPNQISCYEIKLKDTEALEDTRKAISELMGTNYKIQAWYEQHQTLYQVLRNEKIIGYLIILFMLTLISFNIIGTLTMVVIEKKKDIGVLLTLGAHNTTIRAVFLWEALYIGGLGGGIGVLLGAGFCILQQKYSLLRFDIAEESNLIVDAFPVVMEYPDFIVVILTVLGISLLSGYFPAKRAAQSDPIQSLKP